MSWKKLILFFGVSLSLFTLAAFLYIPSAPLELTPQKLASKKQRLYWFIPDGFRADHFDFNIYDWAKAGELPNIKFLMENGCRGYSRPVFPGHTPVNFATLMTGVSPSVHGVVDGSMRLPGYPLNIVMKGGFSSYAKLVSPIWVQMEQSGKKVSLQSIPGSTPPELFLGNTIKGRWGAWGVEFPSVVFQDQDFSELPTKFKEEMSQNGRVFGLGSELTKFTSKKSSNKWLKKTFTDGYEVDLSNWGAPLFARLQKTDGNLKPLLEVSMDRQQILARVGQGEWTDWIPIRLKYELKNDYQKNSPKKSQMERELSEVEVETFFKLSPIFLSDKTFRIRVIYDGLNELMTSPETIAESMREKVGHMVDYVDSYPPQLVYFPEDKAAFLQEAKMSWEWHQKAVPYLINSLKSDVVIHSIYTPNQMLTSRWWLPFLDKESYKYKQVQEPERMQLWSEVKGMYQEVDALLGNILAEVKQRENEDWYIVLSSDHGALPLYKEVRLNNLFHQKKWLSFKFNEISNEFEIDWKKTKVVYLQMNNIYINPNGLDGPYTRSSGPEFEKLRSEVESLLAGLEDPETKARPLYKIWKTSEASMAGLLQDRVGDLVVANIAQYAWSEDISMDQIVFAETKKGGHKQGIWPKSAEGMLTPFMIFGPRIKKNCEIKEVINHVDQFATIEFLLNLTAPYKVEGRVLNEVF